MNISSDLKNLSFGKAIEALKAGQVITREGWNEKGIWLYKTVGNTVPKFFIPNFTSLLEAVKHKLLALDVDVVFKPQITMFTAEQEMQPGWLAAQADILAEDWMIL